MDPRDVLEYAHLTQPEQAKALDVSIGTIKRSWVRLVGEGIIKPDDVRWPRRGGRTRTADSDAHS